MEKCFNSYPVVQGFTTLNLYTQQEFKRVGANIISQVSSLKSENKKEKFREKCKSLADYLINTKDPYRRYQEYIWKGALRTWYSKNFTGITQHGGCFMIFNNEEKNLLELIYDAYDFCEKKEKYMQILSNKCSEYETWFEYSKIQLQDKRSFIEKSCKNKKELLELPRTKCNILKSETFNQTPVCIFNPPAVPEDSQSKSKSVESEEDNIKGQVLSASDNQKNKEDSSTNSDKDEDKISTKVEVLNKETKTSQISLTENETPHFLQSESISPRSQDSIKRHDTEIMSLPPKGSNSVSLTPFPTHPIIQNDPFRGSIFDDDEIIKKIEIHEEHKIKNVNTTNIKKKRSKTIIEVHMEVLNEYKKDEWESTKVELLEICIEEIMKEHYRTYNNITNNEHMENISSSNENEKNKILWNKWSKANRSLSKNLRKAYWFINLKNEWKNEKSSLKKTEEFNKNHKKEIQKLPFIEREKELWKRWISKKIIIIEQYIEQDLSEEITEELQNMSCEYENEGTHEYKTLINTREVENKGYKELYKYIKKKLLTKLCILVLMLILDECQQEEHMEYKESYLDNSINEWKKEEITKNINDMSADASENKENSGDKVNTKNMENISYIWKDNFRKELKYWTTEDDTYVNSMNSDNYASKYY
ncbi:STP1 protein [Plasmodium malariae]|uniref:STP1 protein n=1 Tax=Plasmodium malariae TaxID=5858 RepID=A0A1D3SM27_PLAMA|nr:STP1 protein [Plasmodium malariae]SCO92863.1 STP1 protein [Plasmodium malariae]